MPSQCANSDCELLSYGGHSHCILHWTQKTPSHVAQFKPAIEKLIDEGYNHFHQIQFPSGYNSFPEKFEFSDASFIDCHFESGFDFLNTTFSGNTTFERNVFDSDVRFLTCEIQGDFIMSANYFSKQLFFSHLKTIPRKNKIVLQNLTGSKPEYVINNLLFDSCKFINTTLNIRSMLVKSAQWKFVDNEFLSSKLLIKEVELNGDIEFRKNRVDRAYGNLFRGSEFHISNSTLGGQGTIFGFSSNFDSKSKMDFYNVKFAADKTSFRKFNFSSPTTFARCIFNGLVDFSESKNPSNCLFKQSNIEDINFDGADWSKPYKVRDETILERDFATDKVGKERKKIIRKEYLLASHTYRRLKLNYEKRLDFLFSSFFYVREKECLRKSLPWYKQGGYLFLKITCVYGESLPMVISLAIYSLIIFGTFYLFSGFKYKNEEIVYHFTFTNINFEWGDLGLAMWLSAKSILVPLRLLGDFKIETPWLSFIRDLESVIGAFLIGLFVFVFRRHLRK